MNDYSGPYREVFADAMREVTEEDESRLGTIGVLMPSPTKVEMLERIEACVCLAVVILIRMI